MVKSKKVALIIIFIFLLLDFAALDDVTTGSEPSFVGEYAMLVVSIPVFVVVGKALVEKG